MSTEPERAGEFIIDASIVHLAGVVADYEELEPSRRPATLPFNPYAITATGFVSANLSALLTARAQLQDTLASSIPTRWPLACPKCVDGRIGHDLLALDTSPPRFMVFRLNGEAIRWDSRELTSVDCLYLGAKLQDTGQSIQSQRRLSEE